MGLNTSAAGAGSVLYCGDFRLIERAAEPFSPLFTDRVEVVSPQEIAARLADNGPLTACLILTFCDEQVGRLRIPSTDTPHGRARELIQLLTDLAATLPPCPRIILLTQSGLPLDLCCDLVALGVSHFLDIDSAGWERRLLDRVDPRHNGHTPPAAARSAPELLDAVGICAISPAMQSLILQVHRGAQVSDATVLIQGESGTGKQLIAEAVHHLDPKRAPMPFVSVNCAAITGTLAESELFGHSRGAFSGATDPRLGYFRSAHRGTIFLDEISELPMYLQPKLLRVLQERRVLAVGADKEEPIDVRVVAASNVNLQEKVAKGEFRLDLYQRLNVIHLAIPPLRQRTEDIPLLVQHFLRKYRTYSPIPVVDVDVRVYELLKKKSGVGNVRELENVIRQALIFKTGGDRLELQDLPRVLLEGSEHAPSTEIIPSALASNLVELIRSRRLTLKQVVETFEKTLIRRASQSTPAISKVELAKVLGVPRRTLYYKLDSNDSH